MITKKHLLFFFVSTLLLFTTGHSQDDQEKIFSIIDSASYTMTKSEHLEFLLSLVSPDSKHDQAVKDIAALELKEKFVPEGAIYEWKKSNFLTAEDIIEYINSRDKRETKYWLKLREIPIVEKSTKNYTLTIQSSDIMKVKEFGVEDLSVSEVAALIRSKGKSKGLSFTRFERIDLLRPRGFDKWIAVGLYTDGSGELRMTALVSEDFAILDRPKEKSGWSNGN